MDRQIAMDWADLLESGKYPQGEGALCANGKFCCLGVLSEMAVKAGIATKVASDYTAAFSYQDVELSRPEIFEDDEPCPCCVSNDDDSYRDGSSGVLTNKIQEWAGMSDANGTFPDNIKLGKYASLTAANDDGISFPVIAQFIRENYESL